METSETKNDETNWFNRILMRLSLSLVTNNFNCIAWKSISNGLLVTYGKKTNFFFLIFTFEIHNEKFFGSQTVLNFNFSKSNFNKNKSRNNLFLFHPCSKSILFYWKKKLFGKIKKNEKSNPFIVSLNTFHSFFRCLKKFFALRIQKWSSNNNQYEALNSSKKNVYQQKISATKMNHCLVERKKEENLLRTLFSYPYFVLLFNLDILLWS